MSFLDDIKLEKPDAGAHPLIHFKGVLETIEEDKRVFTDSDGKENPRTFVKFHFSNVEPIEVREPYPLDSAIYSIAYQISQSGKPRRNSRWAAWTESVRALLPTPDIKLLIGKQQEWKEMPCKLSARNSETNKWEDVDSESMQVVAVEGYGDSSESVFAAIADMLAAAKDENSFYAAVINDPKLKTMAGFSEIVNMITSRQLINTLVTMGLVTKEGDTYWRKDS